jgi:hypothetical protein
MKISFKIHAKSKIAKEKKQAEEIDAQFREAIEERRKEIFPSKFSKRQIRIL